MPSDITTTSFSSAPDHVDSSLPQIPYSTARVFKNSSFTYTFPVSSQGPKFLRLYFYPANYSDLNTQQSFFDVSSNGYSLLTCFNAFLAVSFMRNTRTDARVVKEFLIYVKDTQILSVTFTPSPNSYAFINGIEIVSAPEDVYFNSKTPKYVNQYTGPIIDNDTALENIYRLNMGGGQIPAQEDTGMYRSWDQDTYYIYGAAVGLTPVYNNPITYTMETPSYTARVIKEYLINVKDGQILNLTFTPTLNSHAFINAIEIVHLPDDLYFKHKSLNYVRMINKPVIDGDMALENFYRLNMCGRQIPGQEDTGMYRSWDQDDNYIYSAAIGLTPVYDNPITYTTETPNYTAPEAVYQTQRSMGEQSDKYNLTWILPVDSGFYYMLRLHFCNIIPQYTKLGQVIFRIYIHNQTAEEEADLFYWTPGSGYPVFKDYIVFVNDPDPDGTRSKQDLWLAMHPNRNSELYLDAYLNGLEVFKLSMDNNLASPNPEQCPKLPSPNLVSSVQGNKKTPPYATIIGLGAGGFMVLLLAILFLTVLLRVKQYFSTIDDKTSRGQTSSDGTLPSDRCHRFTLHEVKIATDEFNDNCCIGSGGFGMVYKGYIDNTTTTVAIKRLNPSSSQGFHEFWTEIALLSKLRHVHLVSMIGYCEDDGEMVLVYDYMARGTLREHLYKTNKSPLSWKRRLDICIGAAKGLHYLHSHGKYAIIHRDVKSTNILLDENWVAKVSDFGLSKLGSKDPLKTHVSTMVKGSFGYIDPEYCRTRQLTEKSDVYSFGVVLFEVLCARPAILQWVRDEQVNFAGLGKSCIEREPYKKSLIQKSVARLQPGV